MARNKRRNIFSATWVVITVIGDIFKSPVLVAWVLVIGGLVTLTAMSVPKLRAAHISTSEVQVTFTEPPIWLDNSVLHELQDVARIHLSKTTVGRDGLLQTIEALGATGWFTNISQVRWISNNQAVVDATFLVPYAMVHDEFGFVFIDAQARRLPTRDGLVFEQKYHFVTLENLIYSRPQRPGLQWNGGDVLDGLNLLKQIYNKPWATQVQSINLARWAENGSIILVTDTPSNLLWGSAPGEERGLEALAGEKIDRLNRVFTKHGRIDLGIATEFDLTNTAQIIQN